MPVFISLCLEKREYGSRNYVYISSLYRMNLYFYRKKVIKCNSLNVFIVTFATLIISDSSKRE